MRVLWCGDAVVQTGFARCTHAVCDALDAAGHEVAVLGINHRGDPHGYPYDIYPCIQPYDGGHEWSGAQRLPRLVERLSPDVVVLLNDPWNIPAYMNGIGGLPGLSHLDHCPPVVGWLAVDAKNQQGEPLNQLSHVVTWTKFAGQELAAGGYRGAWSVVPLGVDLDTFRPLDREAARAELAKALWSHLKMELPGDAWIVGRVDRNQPRKRWDLTIEAFAGWIERTGLDNVYLYIHTAPTGEMGCDIPSLCRYYGVKDRVIFSQQPTDKGVPDEEMAEVYARFDVFMTTTQGEGWGLPTLEAMACGVPTIVPDFAALGEWTEGASFKVPCSSSALTAPLNGHPYTLGGIANRERLIDALQLLYVDGALRQSLTEEGLKIARSYPWSAVGERFVAVLEGLLEHEGVAHG